MDIGFLKEPKRHFIDASRTDLSELEKLDLLQRKKNGDTIYKCLHSNIIREYWEDHQGFPLKKKYHSQGYLVCSLSIRKIAAMCESGDQKVQQVLTIWEKLGFILKDKRYTRRGQTVYILGKWYIRKDKNGKDIYVEELFRDAKRDEYIKPKATKVPKKPKENDYSMYDFEQLHPGGTKAFLTRL